MMPMARYILFAADVVHTTLRTYTPFVWAILDFLTLLGVSLVRCGSGLWVAGDLDKCQRPREPLQLYEYHGCSYSRIVRETLSVLDLDYITYPCPRETLSGYGVCLNSRFRPEVKKIGGLLMFPFLVDPNTNSKLYQSSDIVEHLWKNYGAQAKPPISYRLAMWTPWRAVSLWLCLLLRPCLDMGIMRAPARSPAKPLEFWGYESSSCCQRVQEMLTTLELPYVYHTIAYGSAKRPAFSKEHADELSSFRKRMNVIQVPYLEDPNTGKKMFESKDIVRFLQEQYQTAAVPPESWLYWSSRT